MHEILSGMRINVAEEERDGDQYKFSRERQPEFLRPNTSEILDARENVDLLGLETGTFFLISNLFIFLTLN